MITFTRLGQKGRLGNQMWQIASTMGIAARWDLLPFFPQWEYHNHFPNFVRGRYEYLEKPDNLTEYAYEGTEYRDIILDDRHNWDLNGYFQSEKYFWDIKERIAHLFKTNSMEIISPSVAIHVRRGDYVERSHHHRNLGLEYYQEAMKLFPGAKFDIFSDDINFCRKWFWYGPNYIEPASPVSDLAFMASHTGFIIANSSYSWWAAWLAEQLHGAIIVAPTEWYAPETGLSSTDIVPERWIRI